MMSFLTLCYFAVSYLFETPLNVKTDVHRDEWNQSVVRQDTVRFFDSGRQRQIPVAIYSAGKLLPKARVAIISHGYQRNLGQPYKDYSFIANALAAHGYLVASIQHELPGDPLIPASGPLYETRLPFWERGVSNILFVISQLKTKYPDADLASLVLIGHSNGGDMSMLFAAKYPEKLSKVISLDNRRVVLPRTHNPAIMTLRSSDQAADPDVLPTDEEQKQFGIRVVKLPATIHNDMYDGGTARQKEEMLRYILDFLQLRD